MPTRDVLRNSQHTLTMYRGHGIIITIGIHGLHFLPQAGSSDGILQSVEDYVHMIVDRDAKGQQVVAAKATVEP